MSRLATGFRWPWRTVAVSIVLASTLAACGSSTSSPSSTSSGASSTSSSSGASAGSGLAAAQKKLVALYKYEHFTAPPAVSPKAVRGKNVWEVNVGLALPASGLFANATKAAANALGWHLTIYDAKLQPNLLQDGIHQAIAAKADGILLYNVNCIQARSAMVQAKAAHIPIVGAESLDCSDSKPGDSSLFAGKVGYTQGSFSNWVEAMGRAQADWVIAKTRGQAKVIDFAENDLQTTVILDAAFLQELKTCSTCQIARTVVIAATDIGPTLQQKAQQAILQTPNANALVSPIDDYMTAGIGAAVVSSGRKGQLNVVAGGGYAANLDLVRHGRGQDAGYISSIPWEGYAASDTLNRIFAGQKQPVVVDSGNGIGIYDRDHNVPASGAATVPINFAADYQKAWAGQ
jgi:ribose transport system substrate-binding protein